MIRSESSGFKVGTVKLSYPPSSLSRLEVVLVHRSFILHARLDPVRGHDATSAWSAMTRANNRSASITQAGSAPGLFTHLSVRRIISL